jgi:hypothetical protein
MRSSIVLISLAAGLLVAASASADSATPSAPAAAPAPSAPAADAPAPSLNQSDEEQRTANNALYAEGLGPGLFYSINYERSFSDFAGRIGFGYVSVSAGASDSTGQVQETASASFITVPITVSYLGIGSKRNMLELGAGATIFHVGAGGSTFESKSSSSANESATFVLPVAVVGYRYMPPSGGFLFRAGVSPIFAGSSLPVLPWPYLALGGAF